jgi:predicted MFS family arabinose efflux permease
MSKTNTHKRVPGWVPTLLAVSAGMIVANIYYAQPIAGPMGAATGLSAGAEGLVVTLTQIGYAMGLLFIVPLSDMLENRRLVAASLLFLVAALVGVGMASGSVAILAGSLAIGLTAVSVQVLVPYAAFISTEENRGRVVGNVVGGVLVGIMVARPVASLVTSVSSWRMVFFGSAVLMLVLTVVLWMLLPQRRPAPQLSYGELIGSLPGLFMTQPVLRRNSFYHGTMFFSFSLFWTVAPLHLARAFGYGQSAIALFALVGVTGAAAAPITGRFADKGDTRLIRIIGLSLGAISFIVANIVYSGPWAVALLLVAAIVLDISSTGTLITSQREVYSLGDDIRGRVNGIFMALLFMLGAAGSALGGWLYSVGGWPLASIPATLLPLAALCLAFNEKRATR